MNRVILIALGVGGATIFGGAMGLCFRRISKIATDCVMSFAAGVMLAAAILGLILPSVESGGRYAVWWSVLGIFVGGVCVDLLDRLVRRIGFYEKTRLDAESLGVLLFVVAIAMHNLPEGIAAGVGSGEERGALMIALAIAMQNIPEGLIVTVAMISTGAGRIKAFIISALTGVIEIFATFLGAAAVGISVGMLPILLAIAGGTMLYVICREMIPSVNSDPEDSRTTYFLLLGFSFMLIVNAII